MNYSQSKPLFTRFWHVLQWENNANAILQVFTFGNFHFCFRFPKGKVIQRAFLGGDFRVFQKKSYPKSKNMTGREEGDTSIFAKPHPHSEVRGSGASYNSNSYWMRIFPRCLVPILCLMHFQFGHIFWRIGQLFCLSQIRIKNRRRNFRDKFKSPFLGEVCAWPSSIFCINSFSDGMRIEFITVLSSVVLTKPKVQPSRKTIKQVF